MLASQHEIRAHEPAQPHATATLRAKSASAPVSLRDTRNQRHGLCSSGIPAATGQDIIALQRTAGNRAVQSILAHRASQTADSGAERDANGVTAGAEQYVQRAAASPGLPLPNDVHAVLQHGLGADLSAVRIHTDEAAAHAAAELGASAYTIGQDIYFGAGRYAPSDAGGMHLLAHEAAHTVQHLAGSAPPAHFKLDVSTPTDPAEIEADRAADAVLAGVPFRVGDAANTIYRDATPPVAQPAPTATPPAAAAPPPATTTAPPAATPTPATPADEQVTAQWEVDWKGKATKTAVTSQNNVRTGKDAAYGTLKINPEGSAGLRVFPWVNAAKSGAVPVGSMTHAKNKGGFLSSDIQFGTPPSAAAVISVTETSDADKKGRPSQSLVALKNKAATAAVQAKIQNELENTGDMSVAEANLQTIATTAVGAAPPGYGYQIKVTLTPHLGPDSGNARSAPAVKYDKLTEDSKRIVMITVPTEVQKLKGAASVEKSMNDQSTTAQSSASTDESKEEHLDVQSTQQVTTIKDSFVSAFDTAWQDLKEKSSHSAGSLSGSASGNLDVSAAGGTSFKGLTIDVGTLLAALVVEDAPLALLLSKAIGTATVDGKINAAFAGQFGAKIAASKEWSDDEMTRTLNAYSSHVKTAYSKQTETTATNYVKNEKSTTHVEQKNDSKSESHGSGQKVTSSTETIGIKYIVGDPEITIANN